MTKLRTANLLGTLSGVINDQLGQRKKTHPNESDTSLAALNLLSGFEGCSNVELSKALQLSHPATVRMVDKLEAAGWVERRSGQDRRAVSLWLTAIGRKRVRQIHKERTAVLANLVDQLSEVQRQHLDDIAQTLLGSVAISDWDAAFMCRLCDEDACPQDTCPVHQATIAS